MQTTSDKIKNQIIQVMNKIVLKEKSRVFKFGEVSLYPSEVHLMLMIKDQIDTNATKIAEQLGLTKGAVSQTLSRLEKKGIISKTKDPYHKNELTLQLTGLGLKAYKVCQSIQTSFLEAQDSYLEKLNHKEKEVVLEFMIHMEKELDNLDL